jgi:hypothetical protein
MGQYVGRCAGVQVNRWVGQYVGSYAGVQVNRWVNMLGDVRVCW